MSARQSWVIATAVVLGILILALLGGGHPAGSAAEKSPARPEMGRYQAMRVAHQNSSDDIVVLDTWTGQCWKIGPQDFKPKWQDLGSPAKAQAKK